jgi:pimeloyl-ACP methyl ester carboxylesterase
MLVHEFQRIPYDTGSTAANIEIHSGLSRHYPRLHGNLVALDGASREVGMILIHPSSNFLTHFLLEPIAAVGVPVMGLNTRYAGNDAPLIMENAVLDLGAGIRWMREQLGFERVIVIGFSGGGALASFYQEQAERPTVAAPPGGGSPDLREAGLIPADGVILCAAHAGRARLLRNWIDPAIVDERDPDRRDPALDLFADGRTAPLDLGWVEAYREAQLARLRRITAWAERTLERLTRSGAPDRAFVVHGTVADPRFVDLTLDPSDRSPGSMYGEPRTANMAAGGLARFSTCRSWLSSWSVDHTNADPLRNLNGVTAPVLVMSLLADQAAFASESRQMRDAVPGGADLVELRHLDHYLVGQDGAADRVARQLVDWLATRGLREPAALRATT